MLAARRTSLAAFLLAVACNGDVVLTSKGGPTGQPLANIVVDPRTIDFGQQTSEDHPVQTVTVTNNGTSTLGVDEIELVGPADFEVLHDELPWDLAPDETHTFDVAFTVVSGGASSGQILVRSNADNEPEVAIDLAGFGAVPDLVITPDPMTLGDAFIPCEIQSKFTFTNTGPEPLRITGVTLEGDGAEQLELPFGVPADLVLRKNRPYDVPIVFTPATPGAVAAELVVESTDPDSPHRVPITANARYPREVVETWEVPEQYPLEFVFLVDKSCSMYDDAARLAANVTGFVGALQAASVDWRIGVSTGSADGCFIGGVITNATPNWAQAFSNAVNGGPDAVFTEALVAAGAHSLWWPAGVPACNQALRGPDGTPIHVVMISDEWNQSPAPPSQLTGQPQWKSWLELYYKAYAGPNSTLRIHSIVDTTNNGIGCDGSSNPDDGPGDYLQIAAATGGFGLDLCTANWGNALSQIASQAVGDLSLYKIQDSNVRRGVERPAGGSVQVTFDGVPQTTGWSLSADGKSIDFDPVPPPGTHVEISFGIAFSCP